MSLQDSHPDAVTTHLPLAVRGLLHQFTCGCAVFLLFANARSDGQAAAAMDPAAFPAWLAVVSAGLLIGIGVGFPLQSWIQRTRSPLLALRAGPACTLAGILMCTLGSSSWNLLPGSLLIGLGLFGDWTVSAEVTRRSFSSARQWHGMQLHSLAFYAGAILVTAVSDSSSATGQQWLPAGPMMFCVALLLLSPHASAAVLERLAPSGDAPSSENAAAASAHVCSDADESECSQPAADTDADDACDAENCCGGGREWSPMPVWLGSCLAFTGLFAIGVMLPQLATYPGTAAGSLAVVGALLGTVLFYGVLPTTGYAILLAPCCLLGAAASGLSPWLGAQWPAVWLIIQGAAAAAIYCGCSGLVGESFTDSCQGNSRTVVLMTGSMAAAAMAVIIGISAALASPAVAAMMNAVICLAGLVWLRQIPSLLVSQRREDEIPEQEAEDLMKESVGVAGGPTS